MIKNDLLLRALRQEVTPHTPVWLMRQAGRYLPEYRTLREQSGDFMTMCRTPEIASEITLQPIRRYPLDAAIIFSDILTVPDAMGLGLKFVPDLGPLFTHPLKDQKEILNLRQADVDKDLRYVAQAIEITRKELNQEIPLIGFCGSAYTLACYMVEGHGSKTFANIKTLLYASPSLLHHLLKTLTNSLIDYLNMQIEAGVDVIQIFDTWGGNLPTKEFLEFSLEYTKTLISGLKPSPEGKKVPVIVFTKDAPLSWYEAYSQIEGVCAIGVDWRHELESLRKHIPLTLQGNLDPMALMGSDEYIVSRTREILASMKGHPHIFNLGHGIDKSVSPQKVNLLINTIHSFSGRKTP